MSDVIKVDIWSDIACPWCYIGKRKFEAGVARFGGEVEVEYHCFELAPDTPVDFDGTEVDFLVKHKGMPAAQVAADARPRRPGSPRRSGSTTTSTRSSTPTPSRRTSCCTSPRRTASRSS